MADHDKLRPIHFSDLELQLFVHADSPEKLAGYGRIAAELYDSGMDPRNIPIEAAHLLSRQYVDRPATPIMTANEEHIIRGEN
jgi:hypothetical protein